MRPVSQARKVATIGAVACATVIAIACTMAGTEGCYTHQCDVSYVTLGLAADGGVAGTGEILTTDGTSLYWESNPVAPAPGQTWTPFRGNEYLTFVLPPDAGIPSNAVLLNYWSYDAAQDAAQVNNINNSGQLAEYSDAGTGSITVYNSTCADYFVRVVVQFLLPEPSVDAGGGDDAAEAGRDAQLTPGPEASLDE